MRLSESVLHVVAVCFFLSARFADATSANGAVLDDLLEALHEQTGVPGLSVAVSRRGNLLWHGEAGFADVTARQAVDRDTVFRLASVSKAVCAVIVARMVEEDAIDVDARAGELMPDLPEQYQSLTLRDLLTHTSGLPHYEARDFARGGTRYSTAVAGLEQLGDRSLVAAPGASYLYSTHGFSLASAMLERATEQTFTELFTRVVSVSDQWRTLALESEGRDTGRRTLIYEASRNADPRELAREDFSYSWCGAGMEASAADLSNFASSLFGTRSVLGRAGQRLLADAMRDRNGDVVITERWVMTFGWRQSTDASGENYLHHAGVTNGARSILAVWPKTGLAVSLLSNASWTGRMEDTAVAFAAAADQAAAEKDCINAQTHAYAGSYRDAPIIASIEWRGAENGCRGHLTGSNALTEWLARFNYASPDGHTLLRLDQEFWGLVSPIGISLLSGDRRRLSGYVGSGEIALRRTERQSVH